MREPCWVVGAFVRDRHNRVFAQRRSPGRRLLPGTWDVVGGHVEPGESLEQALAREVAEETGWRLRRIEAVLADWEWALDGVVRRERDYLIEVDGDLAAPKLEPGKHDAFAWVGPDNLDLMLAGRDDGDRRLRDVVAKATRTRLTTRLRLEPIGFEHAADMWLLHQDRAVARWYGGRFTIGDARGRAASAVRAWDSEGVDRWMAYERTTGELVGRGGLTRAEVAGRLRLDMGWTVRGDRWGQGFATEIGRAGLAFAFTDLGAGEVVAHTEPHNQRSLAVMRRLGMEFLHEIASPPARGPHPPGPLILYRITRHAWARQLGDPAQA